MCRCVCFRLDYEILRSAQDDTGVYVRGRKGRRPLAFPLRRRYRGLPRRMRCFAGGFSTLSTGLSTSSVGLRRQLPLKGKPGKTRCGGIGASGTPPPTARIARPARLSRRAGIAGSGACFGYTMPRAAQLLKIRAAVNSQSLCDTPPQPFLGEDTSGSAVLSAERTALPLESYTMNSGLPRGYMRMVLHAKQDKMSTAADE